MASPRKRDALAPDNAATPSLAGATEEALRSAVTFARRARHEFVTVEHLLFALTADPGVAEVLRRSGVDGGVLDGELRESLGRMERRGFLQPAAEQTPALWRVLERAVIHRAASGRGGAVEPVEVLAALLSEKVSPARDLLLAHGVTRVGVLELLSHGERLDATARPVAARRCRVLIHNDPYTTMDFVVSVLTSVFGHAPDDAKAKMMDVHTRGVGEVGGYEVDLAVGKVEQVRALAREAGFPLKCTVEPE